MPGNHKIYLEKKIKFEQREKKNKNKNKAADTNKIPFF